MHIECPRQRLLLWRMCTTEALSYRVLQCSISRPTVSYTFLIMYLQSGAECDRVLVSPSSSKLAYVVATQYTTAAVQVHSVPANMYIACVKCSLAAAVLGQAPLGTLAFTRRTMTLS